LNVSGGINGSKTLAVAVDEYLSDTQLTKKSKTLAAYTTALRYFLESCHRLHVEDITRSDMLKFAAFRLSCTSVNTQKRPCEIT